MPNAILKVKRDLSKNIDGFEFYHNSKGVYLYPVLLEHESFFVRITQKGDRVIVRLDKATMPKITSGVKSFLLEFCRKLAEELDGDIIHHNFHITKKTDYDLIDKYEISANRINSCGWVNRYCANDILNLEIGMGSGEFITQQAKQTKNESFIGIEVLSGDFYIALRRFEYAKLNNIKSVFYDARNILNRFKPNSVKRVFLNFPEPWFKKKKIKHSVLTPKTAKQIEELLIKNGEFIIRTDNYPFAVSASVILEESTDLLNNDRYALSINDKSIRTKYEKKWIKYKRTIYKLVYRKCFMSEEREPVVLDFPLKINLGSKSTQNHIFKILDIFTNRKQQRIVEVAIGYSKYPQHIFFSLDDDLYIDKLPQSNFVVNDDFLIALSI